MLTVAEVSERLRCSKMTVYRICKEPGNPLSAVRIGRGFRIPEPGFQLYIRHAAEF